MGIRYRLLILIVAIFAGLAYATPPRSADDILEEIDKTAAALGDVSPTTIGDPKQRAVDGKYVPVLRKLVGLSNDLSANPDPAGRMRGATLLSRYRVLLIALDDDDTIRATELETKGSDPTKATVARTDLVFGRWLKASVDAQPALADEAASLARDNPANEQLASDLYSMTQIGHPTAATTAKLEDALLQMKGKSAKDYGEQIQSMRKLRTLIGKPLVVHGMVAGQPGKEFSSESLKGKVVLLDFWATWCVPCMKVMPHVQQLYKADHEKGFEILGISCDDDAAELSKYLKATPQVAWPQLYDGMTPGWNPIATKLGISSIPAMILIDRKGIVRSVEAEEELDALVQKLIDEPK